MGKIALVTGASSGIGRATALKFADAGIKVALVARRKELLESLKLEIAELGGTAEIMVADVGEERQAAGACEWALGTFGCVDILVNNAGIVRPGLISEQDPQEWRDTFNINLLAPMYMTQGLLASMKQHGSGHIVNISSNAAKIPGGATQSSYSASKYAMTAFSSSLRKETAEHGIRVTIIEPGATTTDVADSIPDEKTRQMMDTHMRNEVNMQAEDIAAAIYYAISQPARVNVSEIWLTPSRRS